MVGAEVGALLLEREDAPSLLGAVDLGERLAVAAKAMRAIAPQCRARSARSSRSPRVHRRAARKAVSARA